MLYKFKSKAAGDLIMLEPNGRRVLDIIGKDPGAKGIILPEEMPPAMKERLAAQGAIPSGNTPAQFAQFIDREIRKWAPVVKNSGAKVD